MANRRTAGKDIVAEGVAASPRRRSEPKTRSNRSTAEPVAEQPKRTGRGGAGQLLAGAAEDPKPSLAEIERLAYSFWEARGYQGGSPEADWFRAEQELRSRAAGAAMGA
jgi:hypothetical protein